VHESPHAVEQDSESEKPRLCNYAQGNQSTMYCVDLSTGLSNGGSSTDGLCPQLLGVEKIDVHSSVSRKGN